MCREPGARYELTFDNTTLNTEEFGSGKDLGKTLKRIFDTYGVGEITVKKLNPGEYEERKQ